MTYYRGERPGLLKSPGYSTDSDNAEGEYREHDGDPVGIESHHLSHTGDDEEEGQDYREESCTRTAEERAGALVESAQSGSHSSDPRMSLSVCPDQE